MRVLVTGSSTFFGGRLVQELGKQGAAVTAADSLRFSCGKVSRYTSRRVLTPTLGTDPEGYLRSVIQELQAERYDLLLPAFEETLLLAEYQDEVRPLTRCFLPSYEAIRQVHQKPLLHQLCQELGIPSPPSVCPTLLDDLEASVRPLRFPVFIKPPMGNNSVGRVLCRDFRELSGAYRAFVETQPLSFDEFPLVQQRIEGELVCTLMLCHRGAKLGEVIYRNLRTFPDGGGTSAHRETIEHPRIAAFTETLAQATAWSGFLGFDFIVEKTTGTPYLIDANPRANPAVHVGYLAGVNWTAMFFALLEGRQPPFVAARPGVRARSRLLDTAWLLEGLRPQKNWLSTAAGRLRRFFRPEWPLDSRTDLLSGEDRLPSVAVTAYGLHSILKAWATGEPVGKLMLEDANYNAQAAADFARRRRSHAARASQHSPHRVEPALLDS